MKKMGIKMKERGIMEGGEKRKTFLKEEKGDRCIFS
jgi:hypothetical protein